MFKVELIPQTGADSGKARLLVDKYDNNRQPKLVGRCLTDKDIAERKPKKYRPCLFATRSEAIAGADQFINKLRQKWPGLREFQIEACPV